MTHNLESNLLDWYCRLCGSNHLHECLILENAPSNIQRLLASDQVAADLAITLVVYQCQECGLVQLAQTLDTDYYDDYMMTVSHSPQMTAFQRSQAVDFVSKFDLAGKRVIEVGCGDGNYLQYLREARATVCGIEPSRAFRQMAQSRDLQVLEGFVSREQPIPDAPYDAFVSRQVLEHVPDPNSFLQGIRRALSPRGVGLVEVPSLEQTLEGGRFYDFFPDHISYFSSLTLRQALERNGFEVMEMSRGMNGEYNVALVRKAPEHDFADLQYTLDVVTKNLRVFVDTCNQQGKRIAVWGAGGKGITVLAIAQVKPIAYVIDSDPHKHGCFTPVSHFPVFAPEKLLSDPVDAVIVTALAYRDEILTQLREGLGYRGTIAIVGKELQIVQDSQDAVRRV